MKLIVVLAVLIGTLVLACSTAAWPIPNIEATIEAESATPLPTYTFPPAPTRQAPAQRHIPRVAVTKAMYLQIQDGMSYQQVVRIIGIPG